ncbi:MAG TPA: hypothetical protein VL625_07455, partial [Patescibacteria group bacterium]|nr:hypothetical protein [Patescibacteria group bacterium]
MGGNDPKQVPPPSAPPPTIGQQPVTGGSNIDVDARVVINPQQRGSLSGGYNVYAQQGYNEYLQQVRMHFGEIAQYRPDIIAHGAERFDLAANRETAFYREGQFAAQYSMINGRYTVGKIYDLNDPRSAFQLEQDKARTFNQAQNIDPRTAAAIQARHEFENLGFNGSQFLAGRPHVYPNAGEAYFVRDIGGRPYGAKYGVVNGCYQMQQVFDLQNPTDSMAFQRLENNAYTREMNIDNSIGQRYGGVYPRGGVIV